VVVDALAAADADVRTVGDGEALPASVMPLGRIADGAVLHLVERARLEKISRLVSHTSNLRAVRDVGPSFPMLDALRTSIVTSRTAPIVTGFQFTVSNTTAPVAGCTRFAAG
jgi:hypothetical protein